MQPTRVSPFALHQIGSSPVRFPSGAPILTMADMAVDPYAKTRIPKEQVEGMMFWPQEKAQYPGLILLHEWWGLNAQTHKLASRLACEGYTVLVPNLYARQGGMVTVNREVAEALASRLKESEIMQDINSCCEFLGLRDHVKRNIYGVIGFGMGGSLAISFACRRKRLRAAVAFYGKVTTSPSVLKDLACPLLFHRAGADPSVTDQDIEQLQQAAKEFGKQVEIRTYDGAPHAFCDDSRQESYRPEAAQEAWEATVAFLNTCFQGAR